MRRADLSNAVFHPYRASAGVLRERQTVTFKFEEVRNNIPLQLLAGMARYGGGWHPPDTTIMPAGPGC
jgi:hypothetical protein